jgi:hypothetical protein
MLPFFERAEIFESQKKDCILRASDGAGAHYFRVESDGAGGWVFMGGTLLLGRKDLASFSE